jgi:hypothetical protein
MIDEHGNRQRLYLEELRKAYIDWIERTTTWEAYHRSRRKSGRGYVINYYAIKKNFEMREMAMWESSD